MWKNNMINISEEYRNLPHVSHLNQITSYENPDVFMAENILDFQQNNHLITVSKYKLFPWSIEPLEVGYINFHNVRLVKYAGNTFNIIDGSGNQIVSWDTSNLIFPAKQSYEEAQEKQGLENGNWVHSLQLGYDIHSKQSAILSVQKNEFDTKGYEKESLLAKIKSFFPDFEADINPLWQ